MVWPSREPIPLPLPSAGYLLRQFQQGDEAAYDELFHLGFEDLGRLDEIRGRALDGGFFVIEHVDSGDLVASCVAMRAGSSPRHQQAGQLGWLVTDPAHIRKGLGRVVAAAATNRLAESSARPFLGTEDFRTVAISIYLKLGWCPYIYRPEMEARWREIFVRLSRDLR